MFAPVRPWGTTAACAGVVIMLVNVATTGAPLGAFVVGGLLLVSGLLLRIEAAVVRAGSPPVDSDRDDGPPDRPWHRGSDGGKP